MNKTWKAETSQKFFGLQPPWEKRNILNIEIGLQ